jgi:ABC-type Fe3+/spermidine/putrescine transport system ATPase subunit
VAETGKILAGVNQRVVDTLSAGVACNTTEAAPAPVLSLAGVSKAFGALRAVNRINLSVRRGEFFTLLGPSGCGKTTTLRMVAGLEQPDEGEIWLRGRAVAIAAQHRFLPPEQRNLGMVFQSYAVWPHMTVFENVAYALRLRHWNNRNIRDRVGEVLALVGLSGLEERPAPLLSGGQQQRLALCRALVYEPDVLLLDEPFSNLDAKLREQMRVELKRLHERLNITVLFVTHDQLEALSLSDTIAVMSAGVVEQMGSPKVLYEQPRSAFVRDFIGQTLLLPGHFRRTLADGACEVDLDEALRAPASLRAQLSSQSAAPVARGQAVHVAIRPEEVQLISEDQLLDSTNILSAVVEATLFVGERYQVSLKLHNGQHVLLHVPRSRECKQGQVVFLRLQPESAAAWLR